MDKYIFHPIISTPFRSFSVRILFIVLFLFTVTAVSGQKLVYKVEWKGDSIGYLIAEKTNQGGLTTIELSSITEFSLIFSFHMSTEYLTVYRDDQLISALSRSTLNNKERDLTRTKYMDQFYQIEKDGETDKLVREITESIATLYFTPPTSNEIFSERHGVFCRVEKIKENHYRLYQPDNKINDYIYARGSCDEITVELSMAEVHLKRIL